MTIKQQEVDDEKAAGGRRRREGGRRQQVVDDGSRWSTTTRKRTTRSAGVIWDGVWEEWLKLYEGIRTTLKKDVLSSHSIAFFLRQK
ncbi:hypothetical protein QVD17_31312 [Tagetes erecta]|uniref:Uncharacterized protein n=1 Tax=Tagetes erecta TaxID=13708 RepID=A0AAD8K4B0_TARER|nr:hypothetical protein QVD17_31312 [Tagetes erecta]